VNAAKYKSKNKAVKIQYMQNINTIIEETVTGMGYDLVDIENKTSTTCIYIDTLDLKKTISIDDCVNVSNQLTRIFEVENIDYNRLEVSTPGIDRPIKKLADYVRYEGHEVVVTFKETFNGKKRYTGIILAPSKNEKNEDVLHIETLIKQDVCVVNFFLHEVNKAKLSLEPYFDNIEKTKDKKAKPKGKSNSKKKQDDK
jgi:ribosome maturation factor RimP